MGGKGAAARTGWNEEIADSRQDNGDVESSPSATVRGSSVASRSGTAGAQLIRVAQPRQPRIQRTHQDLFGCAIAQTLARRPVEPITDPKQSLLRQSSNVRAP